MSRLPRRIRIIAPIALALAALTMAAPTPASAEGLEDTIVSILPDTPTLARACSADWFSGSTTGLSGGGLGTWTNDGPGENVTLTFTPNPGSIFSPDLNPLGLASLSWSFSKADCPRPDPEPSETAPAPVPSEQPSSGPGGSTGSNSGTGSNAGAGSNTGSGSGTPSGTSQTPPLLARPGAASTAAPRQLTTEALRQTTPAATSAPVASPGTRSSTPSPSPSPSESAAIAGQNRAIEATSSQGRMTPEGAVAIFLGTLALLGAAAFAVRHLVVKRTRRRY